MLNKDFCDCLEHELTKVLRASTIEQVKGLWCDGILLPENVREYSNKVVNDKRQIELIAFIGNTGQDRYKLTLRLGKKALSKYARGLDITDCIPSSENLSWLYIDTFKKQVVIQLD